MVIIWQVEQIFEQIHQIKLPILQFYGNFQPITVLKSDQISVLCFET